MQLRNITKILSLIVFYKCNFATKPIPLSENNTNSPVYIESDVVGEILNSDIVNRYYAPRVGLPEQTFPLYNRWKKSFSVKFY